jgi:hypothetical protein
MFAGVSVVRFFNFRVSACNINILLLTFTFFCFFGRTENLVIMFNNLTDD